VNHPSEDRERWFTKLRSEWFRVMRPFGTWVPWELQDHVQLEDTDEEIGILGTGPFATCSSAPGDEGDFVFKPRNQWHTFWKAGDTPCRILEIISPSGFEHFFDELAELVAQPDFSPEKIVALGERYEHYFDLERTAAVAEEHRHILASSCIAPSLLGSSILPLFAS
jgi:hypothetical protein